MPLSAVAVLAALAGLTEALAVSASGHGAIARLWLDAGARGTSVDAAAAIGAGIGLAAVARRRLGAAIGEGVRAIARPSLFAVSQSAEDALVLVVGTAASLLVSAATLPRVEVWAASPTANGVGLCVTGVALASAGLTPRHGHEGSAAAGPARGQAHPTIAGAVVAGVAHGLAVLPGASRVGAALTVLLWMGVRPSRAADLAFLLTVPALFVAGARAFPAGIEAPVVATCLGVACLAAAFAGEGLRALAERHRVAALALWTIPLGLAMLAYARALPTRP